MSAAAVHLPAASSLLTYVWHYMLARVLYDELVRPALRGHVAAIVLVGIGAGALLLIARRWRWRARRRA